MSGSWRAARRAAARARSGGRSGTAAPTTASTATGAAGEGAARRRGLPGPGKAGARWGRSAGSLFPGLVCSQFQGFPPLPPKRFFKKISRNVPVLCSCVLLHPQAMPLPAAALCAAGCVKAVTPVVRMARFSRCSQRGADSGDGSPGGAAAETPSSEDFR